MMDHAIVDISSRSSRAPGFTAYERNEPIALGDTARLSFFYLEQIAMLLFGHVCNLFN